MDQCKRILFVVPPSSPKDKRSTLLPGSNRHCCWGLCKNDTRYPEKLPAGCLFIPFPKPKRSLEKCMRWIKACGRPHSQLNVNKINLSHYVCNQVRLFYLIFFILD